MMNVDIINLLNDLRARGAMPVLERGELKIKKPDQLKLEVELVESLQQNKKAIISFLSSSECTTEIDAIDCSMERIPLSYAQERIWLIEKFETSTFHHIPTYCKISGDLNVDALKSALNKVMSRHKILRTVYHNHNGVPSQQVLEETIWPLDMLDFGKASYHEIMAFIHRETNRPFRLHQEPSIRAVLLKASHDCYYFSIVFHEIAADGWSVPVFYKNLFQSYDASLAAEKPDLPILNFQYLDYACWQRARWDHNTMDNKLAYWQHKLLGSEPLELNTDFSGKAVRNPSDSEVYRIIPKEVSMKIRQQFVNQEFTSFMYFLAAYKVLLHNYTGQRDLLLGSPVANRQHKDTEALIGCFSNVVPMRMIINPDLSFNAFLKKVKETVLEAYQNQDVPIEKIIEKIENVRYKSHNALIRSLFILEDKTESNMQEVSDIKLEWETIDTGNRTFELILKIEEHSRGFGIRALYCEELFKKETIDQIVRHLESILTTLTEQPDITISEFSLIVQKESEEAFFFAEG